MSIFRLAFWALIGIALWYIVIGHRTRVGRIVSSRGEVKLVGGYPLSSVIFEGTTLELRGLDSFAELQLQGELQARLEPLTGTDVATLYLGSRMRSAPCQTLQVIRGRIRCSVGGERMRPWISEVGAPGIETNWYGYLGNSFTIEHDGSNTRIQAAAGGASARPLEFRQAVAKASPGLFKLAPGEEISLSSSATQGVNSRGNR